MLKIDKPKVYRIERNFLQPEDAFKLLAHCKEHYLGSAIWLGVLAGLRPSETQALQWRSVDFEKGQILVCSSFNRSEESIQPHPQQKDWLIVPVLGHESSETTRRYVHKTDDRLIEIAKEITI